MVFIAQRDKAEWLMTSALELARRRQHFRHAVDGARTSVEGDFDEIANSEFALQLKNTASYGNGLKFCASSLSTFRVNCRCNRSVELNARRSPGGVGLGEMTHTP